MAGAEERKEKSNINRDKGGDKVAHVTRNNAKDVARQIITSKSCAETQEIHERFERAVQRIKKGGKEIYIQQVLDSLIASSEYKIIEANAFTALRVHLYNELISLDRKKN